MRKVGRGREEPSPSAFRGAADASGPGLEVEALRRLFVTASFSLRRGECVALQGPSGSGKTLLLRAVADLDPAEGQVRWDGEDRESIPGPRWRRRIGYVAAEPGWWAEKVDEHFECWSQSQTVARSLGLPDGCGDWPVRRLSTGERQRLALVRALEVRPDVLLLDEPTSALDPHSTRLVEDLLRDRRAAGLALVWATHDERQAQRVAERRLVLDQSGLREEML